MARKFQPKVGSTLAALLCCAILLTLGFWQLERLAWKAGLLQTIAARMAEKPQPLPESLQEPDAWEFRRVSVAGHYLDVPPVLVKPRTFDGKTGYHVLMPFQRLSGGYILVNRGFVDDENIKKISTPTENMQIDGVVTLPHKNRFTPDNAPDKKDWYWSDTQAMGASYGLNNVLPVVLQLKSSAAGAYPVAVAVAVDLPNDHRQYAIFWFTMAAIMAVIYFVYHWKEQSA